MLKIEVELIPWDTPDFAKTVEPPAPRQDGLRPLRTIPLYELPANTFQQMVEAWLMETYRKAGREPNWRFD